MYSLYQIILIILATRISLLPADRKSAKSDSPAIDKIISTLGRMQQINKPVVIELERSLTDSEIDFSQIEHFLRPPFRADIILVLHSDTGVSINVHLKKKKLRVPQDIALISMEDGVGFDLMFTPVTSLKTPFPGLSIKAANMIWSEVKNAGKGKFKRQVNIAPNLIVRNSCGTI